MENRLTLLELAEALIKIHRIAEYNSVSVTVESCFLTIDEMYHGVIYPSWVEKALIEIQKH